MKFIRVRIKSAAGLKFLTLLLSVGFSQILSAQDDNEILKDKINSFTYAFTVQTKGISTIPNLTLGKPAAIFDLKIGRKLTFEPQFRFALTGKPWATVFWWRYNPTISDKVRLTLHTNYSFSYKTITVESSGVPQDIIRTTRYLVTAIEPYYLVSQHFNVGAYISYNHGIEKFIVRDTYMFSFRTGISDIPITKNVAARVNPEIYYMKMDNTDGIFLNARMSINKKNFPFSLSGLLNKPIKSNIPSDFDFLWNVGLSYTFSRKYLEAR